MIETKYPNIRHCPICKSQLEKEHMIKYVDYHCYPPPKDHHYAERIIDGELVAMKIRLNRGKDKIFFKIDIKDNTTEVWTLPHDKRIRISNSFRPDFENVDALFDKMKTYLVFS